VIVAEVFEPTGVVVTLNVADVLPAGIITVAGTIADDWLLESVTASPPAGATLLILTVPVEDLPPFTLAGLSVTESSVGGLIVSVAEAVFEPCVAVIVATR